MTRSVPMVITPSAEVAAFLLLAARVHEEQYRRNGAVVPRGVHELLEAISFGVSQGQVGSSSAGSLRSEQVEPMKPRLAKYETTAELLDISLSSVKRMIRDGLLHPIPIGGSSRIRIAEIDEYIAAQTPTQEAG
jgi:excisionase family DNA binding protein